MNAVNAPAPAPIADGRATITQQLAAFLQAADTDPLPDAVLHAAKRLILNGMRITLNSCDRSVTDGFRKWAYEQTGPGGGGPMATVFWHGTRVPIAEAVFVNTVQWLHGSEVHLTTGTHPSSPAAVAAFAEGELRNSSGRQVLDAIARAIEAELMVATMLGQSVYKRRVTVVGTSWPVGSAAAVSVLRGLSLEQTADALGNALILSIPGINQMNGHGAVKVFLAAGAWIGVVAAQMAALGMEAPPTAFDGEFGLLAAYSETTLEEANAMVAGLGRDWQITSLGFPPYQGDNYTQTPLACVHEIRARVPEEKIASVTSMRCTLQTKFARWITDKQARFQQPLTDFQSSADTPYAMAYAWLTGKSPTRELSDTELARPEIYALRERISFVGVEVDDTDWSKRLGSEVEVTFADGSTERASVAVYHGHPGDPLSDRELEDRVREAAADRISSERTEQIIEAVWALDEFEDISDFTRMLVL